jgi:hypothetical protein
MARAAGDASTFPAACSILQAKPQKTHEKRD